MPKYGYNTNIVALGLLEQNLIYQLNALSCSVVTNCTFFMSSSVIWCAFHTTSTTNQNFLGYLVPKPLNTCIFFVFTMLNDGGGGIGVGVWGGGDGGGRVDGFGIHAILCFTAWSTPSGVLRTLHSSSLSDAPNKGLYLEPRSRSHEYFPTSCSSCQIYSKH